MWGTHNQVQPNFNMSYLVYNSFLTSIFHWIHYQTEKGLYEHITSAEVLHVKALIHQ